MIINRYAKLLGKSRKEVEKILECFNSETYNIYYLDIYKEYFNIFKEEDEFIDFLASIIGSKKVLDIVNNYDNKEFARKLIEKIKKHNKLKPKYILRNTTGTLIKYLTPVELQIIINGSNHVENKINKILSNPKEYKSIDKPIKIKKHNDIKNFEYKIVNSKNNNENEQEEKVDISKLTYDEMTPQQRYDYLFLEDFDEKTFRECVGDSFKNIKHRAITKEHYMRFDKLNLSLHEIEGLRRYLKSINSPIFDDVMESISICYKNLSQISKKTPS